MQLPAMLATRAAAWACLIKLVSSSPAISFPFNAQVPPVARIASTFSFVLADNTFTPGSPTISSTSASSSAASMTYSLDGSTPSWLSIDSAERWLHGTPQDSDVPTGEVVGINFGIVATDDTGSTTMNVTLVVSRNAAPTVEIPIAQQLADSGLPYSEPSSILSYPDTYFNFSFSQSTFSSSNLNYYAVSGDNSPLPSWIAFDAKQIMFSGTTPPSDSLVEPPQTFNFQLIASDVTGFSAASIGFSVVVGSREITADDPSVVLNATVGKELVYDGLQNGIRIDGQVAGPSNLTAKVLSGSSPPDWLTFDTDTWELSGTPPSSAQNSAFSISFSDHLADAVNVTFQVDIDENGTVFRDTLPAMQAQRGSEFRLDLGPYLVQTTGVTVSVETDPKEDWIHFDNSTFVVSGDVPISETDSSISISVRATLDSSKATESETFLLQIMPGTSSNNSTAPSSSTTTTSSPTSTTSVATAPVSPSPTSTQTILLAVLIPTLLLAFVLTIIACCYLRRRRKKQRELSQHLTNKDISDPVPFSFAYNGQDDIGSSMRALDKEYKVSNLNKAYKAQQDQQEKAKLQATAEEIPVGTALAISRDEGDSSDQSQDTMMTRAGSAGAVGAAGVAGMAGAAAMRGDNESDIPDFPAPPSIHTVGMSSSPSSSARSARSNRVMAAANGQWPFEASTIISSVHSRHSSSDTHARSNASEMSHPVNDEQQRDALGILGSIASSSLSRKKSGSVLTRQTVRTSTPMQLDIAVQAAEASRANSAAGGGLMPEHIFTSQEAIVSEGRDSVGTVIVGNGNHQHHHDDVRSSMQAHVDGTRSTLETNYAMDNGTEGQNVGPRGFFTGFASKIANSLKKSVPKARSAMMRFSTHGASSYPSPDAASFDTDLGSVTIGNITTAQPYKPRPVFIGSVNRINEESPQPGSARWTRGSKPGSRASGAVNSRAGGSVRPGSQANSQAYSQANQSRVVVADQRHHGYNAMDDSDDEDDYDGDSILNCSDYAADEAIRLDPPRPAFLAPSKAERSTSDLSQEIASSLSSRRPSSGSSGMSGISAAMEEVRSLLLLPTDSPVSGRSQDSRQQMRRDSDDGLYAPSSNSWETLPSSEPNWTSLYEYVLPGQRSAGGPHGGIGGGGGAATATVTDASSNEPPTPATGVGLPYAFARPTQIHTGSPGSAAQHQAQARARAAQAQAQAQQAKGKTAGASPRHDDAASPRTAAYLTPETQLYREPGSAGSSNDDNDLALSGRGYRHPSSYYGESPYAITGNDYEYPPPFVAGDGSFHDQDEHGDGVNSSGSGASIGMAMSKYPTSQPMTQASLVSAASSGVRAYI
ncbi:polarity establishment/cellular polarization [Sporothrix stenoceras]|uniref:Polarity establishment/cellular polarization n=1 Tax=Sporothrix stenoceras TaxID=5173 RepID=A0ABR3ZF41_9PEZI